MNPWERKSCKRSRANAGFKRLGGIPNGWEASSKNRKRWFFSKEKNGCFLVKSVFLVITQVCLVCLSEDGLFLQPWFWCSLPFCAEGTLRLRFTSDRPKDLFDLIRDYLAPAQQPDNKRQKTKIAPVQTFVFPECPTNQEMGALLLWGAVGALVRRLVEKFGVQTRLASGRNSGADKDACTELVAGNTFVYEFIPKEVLQHPSRRSGLIFFHSFVLLIKPMHLQD